jgi:hypothetical protein
VSLSPRSGRNERSEWRTVRRTVDWRGGAAPLSTSAARTSMPLLRQGPVSFQVYLARVRAARQSESPRRFGYSARAICTEIWIGAQGTAFERSVQRDRNLAARRIRLASWRRPPPSCPGLSILSGNFRNLDRPERLRLTQRVADVRGLEHALAHARAHRDLGGVWPGTRPGGRKLCSTGHRCRSP